MSDETLQPDRDTASPPAAAESAVTPITGLIVLASPPAMAAESATAESAPGRVGVADRSFCFKLDIFDGPLDLLLHLVKENEMDINAIPIAEITRQYLDYLQLMEQLNLALAGEYLEMAATLIRWKARSLLPVPPEEFGEGDKEDPQERLARMLIEYQKYKAAGEQLKNQYLTQLDYVPRSSAAVDRDLLRGDLVYDEANLFDLLKAFKRIVDTVGRTLPKEIEGEQYVLEDAIEDVSKKVRMVEFVRFTDLFLGYSALIQIVVTFLALLELAKRHRITIRPSSQGGELYIYHNAADTAGEGE